MLLPDPCPTPQILSENAVYSLSYIGPRPNRYKWIKKKKEKKKAQGTKVRELDPFDGSNTCKLQLFLVQCQLNFRDRPDTFASDEAKVTFALSYLKGTTLDYFEPALMDLDENPLWSTDYSEFISKLQTNVGPFNPEADAENKLD
jgi:hypothetical protein